MPNGKHEGDLFVDDDLVVTGMVTGVAFVRPGGFLDLRGTVIGGVQVEAGGGARIDGTVGGDVMADLRSAVEINGVVRGQVRGQSVRVSPDAVIGG